MIGRILSTALLASTAYLLYQSYYNLILNNLQMVLIGLAGFLIFASIFQKTTIKILGIGGIYYLLYSFYQNLPVSINLGETEQLVALGIGAFLSIGLILKVDGKVASFVVPSSILIYSYLEFGGAYIPDFIKPYMAYFKPLSMLSIVMSVYPLSGGIAWLTGVIIEPISLLLKPLGKIFNIRIKLPKRDPDVMITMDKIDSFGKDTNDMTVRGDMMEDFIASCWRKLGYEAYTVAEIKEDNKNSRKPRIPLPPEVDFNRADKGLDCVVFNKRTGNVKLIQAKHYSKPLGQEPVDEIVRAKAFWQSSFPKGTKFELEVWTNSSFKKSAKEWANKASVKLVGRKELAMFLKNKLGNKKITDEIIREL